MTKHWTHVHTPVNAIFNQEAIKSFLLHYVDCCLTVLSLFHWISFVAVSPGNGPLWHGRRIRFSGGECEKNTVSSIGTWGTDRYAHTKLATKRGGRSPQKDRWLTCSICSTYLSCWQPCLPMTICSSFLISFCSLLSSWFFAEG